MTKIEYSEVTGQFIFYTEGSRVAFYVPAAAMDLVRLSVRTHKVTCVKAIRAISGASLKESKDFCDWLESTLATEGRNYVAEPDANNYWKR